MRRENDEILFDSVSQKESFEKALITKEGANVFVTLLLEAIGRAGQNSHNAWSRIHEEIEIDQTKEYLTYDWFERRLKIMPLASKGENNV